MTTITISRATVEQALEALKDDQYRLVEVGPNQYEYKTDLAIAALERALAQQAEPVEPVAWCSSVEFSDALKYAQSFNGWRRKYPKTDMPLYTAPPQRKPLTDEEILRVKGQFRGTMNAQFADFARAIEKAHGIGGQP